MKTEEFDLIINGGGMVGASLACALGYYGFKVALIEVSPYASAEQPSFDGRALALTYSSGAIFRNLGVWQKLRATHATAIRQIEVSDAAAGGYARLHAKDVGRDALGWNVEARALGVNLLQVLKSNGQVAIFSPMTLTDLELCGSGVAAEVSEVNTGGVNRLSAKLLVIADGSNSALREQLRFKARRIHYRQRALVCRIEADRKNRGSAYEHFTRSGPLALLPVGESGYSVVWTQEPDEIEDSMRLSRRDFLHKLQACFGDGAGCFQNFIGERKTYPLTLSYLNQFVRPRVVVVGNASHTVHPVAGQGFNLALRDAAALAQVLNENRARGWDIGSYDVLARYERWRARESQNVIWFTDGMLRVFANDWPVLTPVRNLGLDLLQTMPPFKRWLLKRTMGLHGRQPELTQTET